MNWIDEFEGLSTLRRSARELLLAKSSVIEVRENTVVFGPGKTPDHLLLLLEGTVRIQRISEKGREIVLYRIRAGESCVLTTVCMLAYENHSAEAVTESDIRAVAIPSRVYEQLMGGSADFRNYVLSSYSTRIMDLFQVVEDVAFQRLDVRLAEKILEFASGDSTIKITHKQFAVELGTAREVISRQLSEFQRRDWLKQSRGVIEILDQDALTRLSNS